MFIKIKIIELRLNLLLAQTIFCFTGLSSSALSAPQWSVDSLSQIRSRGSAAADGTQLFYSGGDAIFSCSALVDVFDAATSNWTTLQLSEARFSLASAAEDGKLFAGGGRNCINNQIASDTVDILDLELGTSTVEHLPFGAFMSSAAAIGTKVFFAGGVSDTQGVLPYIQEFDTASGNWTLHQLPFRSTQMAAASDDRWVCFAGGGNINGNTGARQLAIYDQSLGLWEHLTLPRSRIAGAAAILDGKLFLGGALFPLEDPRIVDVLDLETRVWSELQAPTPAGGRSAFSVGPFVVFAGGYNLLQPLDMLVEFADVWNSLTEEWTTYPLSTDAIFRDAAAVDGLGAVFAGTDQSVGFGTSNVDVFRAQSDLGASTCTQSTANSIGGFPSLDAVGLLAASENFLTLYADGLPTGAGSFGVLMLSETTTQPSPLPGALGTLCLASPAILHSSLGSISSIGRLAYTLDLTDLPLPTAPQAMVGTSLSFQAWYRDFDSQGPVSRFTSARTIVFE